MSLRMHVCAASAINYCVYVNYYWYCLRKQLALVCISQVSNQLIVKLKTPCSSRTCQKSQLHASICHYSVSQVKRQENSWLVKYKMRMGISLSPHRVHESLACETTTYVYTSFISDLVPAKSVAVRKNV